MVMPQGVAENRQETQSQLGSETGGSANGRAQSTLVNRNVFVRGRRTSLRLEPAMWDAMGEISQRENMTLHELCSVIDERRSASSLTAAIRVFIMTYFRSAATEEGHASIGHGTLYRSSGPRKGHRRGPRRVMPANAH